MGEADQLIRRRLDEAYLELPHLVMAVTADSEVVLRSNVRGQDMRAFGQDLIDLADELTAPPGLDDTKHRSGVGFSIPPWRRRLSPIGLPPIARKRPPPGASAPASVRRGLQRRTSDTCRASACALP